MGTIVDTSKSSTAQNMSRVKSKDLFHFRLTGYVDDDIVKQEAMYQTDKGVAMMMKMMELAQKDDEESTKEYITMFRSWIEQLVQGIMQHPTLQKYAEDTLVEAIKVPTTHCGNFDVPVEIYTPKNLKQSTMNSAIIYAHGGGVISMTARDAKPFLNLWSVECQIVVFNVDYRLAPETKCPNNIKDFYEAIKYICENAASFGVDPNKIAIAGHSGGGYLCLGAMVLLAENNESSLVKLAIPCDPMVDDYCFSDPASMTTEESMNAVGQRKMWKMIAEDFETQKSHPLLFPGKASDEILSKFPPTIISTCEFDQYITESTRLATRLRRAGRLLEFLVIPGAKHCSHMFPDFKCFRAWKTSLTIAIDEYLHK